MENPELMYDGLGKGEEPLDCIESPYYADARAMMNIKLCELLEKLDSRKFQEGSVTLKVTLSVVTAYLEAPEDDNDFGGQRKSTQEYKQPEQDYEVRLNLQQNSKESGRHRSESVFVYRDGRFIASPVPSQQVTFDELGARRNGDHST